MDRQQFIDDFHQLVNMTRTELENWLETPESQSVGIKLGTRDEKKTKPAGEESIGHAMGMHIVEILGKKPVDYSDEDIEAIRKVRGYIKRHMAQGPTKSDVKTSRWRYSLMNWGHDPLKPLQ